MSAPQCHRRISGSPHVLALLCAAALLAVPSIGAANNRARQSTDAAAKKRGTVSDQRKTTDPGRSRRTTAGETRPNQKQMPSRWKRVQNSLQRAIGKPTRTKPQYTRAEEGVVRALATKLTKQYDGRKYQPRTFRRLDARNDNPFMGADNFLEVTLENPRTSRSLVSRAIGGADALSRRKVLVKIKDPAALAKIGRAKDGGPAETRAIQEAIDSGAFEVLDEAGDNVLSRIVNKIGGRKGLERLVADLKGSRGVRGTAGDNLAAGGSALAMPIAAGAGKLGLVYVLLQRGQKAITGVRGMRQRRARALTTFNRTLQETYVSNGSELVLRDGVQPPELGGEKKLRLPDRMSGVEDVYDMYAQYIELLNEPVKDNVMGRSEVVGERQPVISGFDQVEFIHKFKDVGFDPAPGNAAPARRRAGDGN